MDKPVVASCCSTFLKPEMLHVYRQVSGLQRYGTFVLAHERRCADRYPFDDVELIPRKGHIANYQRFYLKYIRREPPVVYRGEFFEILKIFTRRKADVFHVYFGHTGVHLLEFLEHTEMPSIVSFHGADVMMREHIKHYPERLRRLFEVVTLVLTRSQSLADRLAEIGCPREKIRLNRTGIPLCDFPFVQRLMPADGEWHIVQACRLIPKKGLLTALDAFARFRRCYPNARFTIAGDGPMRAELEEKREQLGLGGSVDFVGFLNAGQLNALYRKAHVFLHPSEMTQDANQEGVPNSMLEAMATGLPVIATWHGGIPEAVEHERHGFLVNERDPEGLACALLQIVESSELLQIMGQRASERVHQEFESSKAIENLEQCYDEAVALGKPPGIAGPAHRKKYL